jgi:glutaminase
MDFQAVVDAAFRDAETYRGHGTVASYIPALAEVDLRKMGIAVALRDGSTFAAGDADEPFSIQSLSQIFTLSMVLQDAGATLWNRVGREPAGSPTNSLVQLTADKGKPRNPLVNAGAMIVSDELIGTDDADLAVDDLLAFLRERSPEGEIDIDRSIAMSESRAGAYNRSLAHFLAAYRNLDHPVEDVLSVYFRQCAIAMSCRQLARAGLYLAFGGIDPRSGEAIVLPDRCRRILALLLTCGHYDSSGEFAYRIGLPGKSAISGGILAIAPGHGAVALWSPGLNAAGTSLAGAVMLEKLVERTGWSIFA